MNVSKRIFRQGFRQMIESKNIMNGCYMLDDQGKEVQVTTTMIRTVCHQLLKQCRTIKE